MAAGLGIQVADRQFDTRFNENNFIGMNDRLPSHELPQGVFALLDNVLIANNQIVKRQGNTGSTAITGSQNMLGSIAFERSNGSKSQIICLNGVSNSQLYQSTDGITFTAIGTANLTANALMNFVIASDKVYGFNGTDAVTYDGTTVTKNPSSVPLGQFGFWYHNYLFVGGVSATPNRIFWSNLSDPTTFSVSNFVDINANDGDVLTGIGAFNNELICFKHNGTWTITGWSGATFSTDTIAGQNTNSRIYGFGTPSHRSIVAAGDLLYYLTFSGGIPHIRALQRTMFGNILDGGIVSYELEGTLKGLNYTKLNQVASIYDGKYVYFALPNGSSTTNNLVIQMWHDHTFQTNQGPMNSWVKHASGYTVDNFFLSSISGKYKIYWSDGSTSGKVFVFDSSVNTDNGVATVSTIQTRDFMGDPVRETKWKYVPIKYSTASAGTLNVNARIDQANAFSNQRNISLVGISPGLGPTGTFTLGVSVLGGAATSRNFVTLKQLTGTLLGLQFLESTSNGLTIYDFQVLGNRKGMRTNL